ncbi:MAG: transposase [Bdellovibrionota bacterium]
MKSRKRAPDLKPMDRFVMGLFSFFLCKDQLYKIAVILKPATILKYHQALVKRKYSLLYSAKTRKNLDPKGPGDELIKLILEIKGNNPSFGCPRIADIVNNSFGSDIEPEVVRRVLIKHYRPKGGVSGPSWLTFIGMMKDSLWSMDLFVCESSTLKTHWVLVIMDQYTRRIIGFAVNLGAVDGAALCRMFNEIISDNNIPNI